MKKIMKCKQCGTGTNVNLDIKKFLRDTDELCKKTEIQDYLNWIPKNSSEETNYNDWRESSFELIDDYNDELLDCINNKDETFYNSVENWNYVSEYFNRSLNDNITKKDTELGVK